MAVLKLSEDLENIFNEKSKILKATTQDSDKKEFYEVIEEHGTNLKEISKKLESLTTHLQKQSLKLLDSSLVEINKLKYAHSKEIIDYTKSLYIPRSIDKNAITLFALLNYFQKKYVFKNFILHFDDESFQKKLPWEKIELNEPTAQLKHIIANALSRHLFT